MTNNYISFDVFDTAITRQVYLPTDIFSIIEKKVGNNFAARRVEAERVATQKYTYPTLAQIYETLPTFDRYFEMSIEMDMCYSIQETLSRYKYTTNPIFISDMYLPSSFIREMLMKCGYRNPIVYVSCEEKACKATGELFKKVERKLDGKILKHFGDNYMADIAGAHFANINPIWNPAIQDRQLSLPIVKNPILKKYLAEALTHTSGAYQIGKWIYPVVQKFTDWVLDQRTHTDTKIFFLSRDMYLPYYFCRKRKIPNVHYLHASRKSLAPIALRSSNKDLNEKIKLISSKDELKFYNTEERYKETLDYLKSKDIKDGDIIVDIGYAGTIQALIEESLNVKMQGLYMQVSDILCAPMRAFQFLNRKVISACLVSEFPFCSNEDNIITFKDKQVVTYPDNELRKEYANQILDSIIEELDKETSFDDLSIFDLEQILIHLQFYPSEELLKIYNEPIYTNVDMKESAINFNREAIKQGRLLECYNRSYNKELFKKMLANDKELSCLEKYIH